MRIKLSGVRGFRSIYVYLTSYFVNAALSFVTISLLTHHLSAYDYGIINLYSSFIPLLMPFISGGIMYPVAVEYFKRPEKGYSHFFTNAQLLTLIGLLFFSVSFFIFRHPLSVFLRVTSPWILILPVTVWFVMNNEITMTLYRMKDNPWGFAFYSIGKNLTEILLTIILVIGLSWNWQGRLLSATVSPALFGIFSIFMILRWGLVVKEIDWKEIKRIAWVCSPFIFERLSIFVLSNSDRYFIDKYDLNGTAQVGLYGAGAQVATIVGLVVLSINNAYQPYLFKNIREENKDRAKRGTWLYILATGLVVGGLFVITPFLFRFFIGEKFNNAQVFVYYLSGGYFMWGVYNAFLGYLLFHGKNRLILYFSLAGMISSISLNFYMVPHYGAYGAAVTSIITYTIMAALCIVYSWKYFK